MLTYRTTTREGYQEYKSNPKICKTCPLLAICTESRQNQKVVVRHIWKDALEVCEDIRHQSGMKERYQHRKETIERLFGTAKEYHNLRYTREKGKSKMEDKVGLTLACLNIKKLVKMMTGKTYNSTQISQYYWIIGELGKNIKKTNIKNDVCLHSGRTNLVLFLFVERFRKADFQLYLKIVCSKPKSNPIFGIIFKNIGKEMHYDKVSYYLLY